MTLDEAKATPILDIMAKLASETYDNPNDPVLAVIVDVIARQKAKGLAKYPTTLMFDTPGDMWMHGLEESVDQSAYLMASAAKAIENGDPKQETLANLAQAAATIMAELAQLIAERDGGQAK